MRRHSRVFVKPDNLSVPSGLQPTATSWFTDPTVIEPPVPDPMAERRAAFQRARAAEDERARRRAADVTRFDDPVGKLDNAALVDAFATTRAASLDDMASLLLGETAHLAAIEDSSRLLRTLVGESAQFNPTFAKNTIRNLFEVRFIQEMSKRLDLDERVRDHLLDRFIDREFGPKPSEITVKNYGSEGANSKREPPTRRSNQQDAVGRLSNVSGMLRSSRGNDKPVAAQPLAGGSSPFGAIR